MLVVVILQVDCYVRMSDRLFCAKVYRRPESPQNCAYTAGVSVPFCKQSSVIFNMMACTSSLAIVSVLRVHLCMMYVDTLSDMYRYGRLCTILVACP